MAFNCRSEQHHQQQQQNSPKSLLPQPRTEFITHEDLEFFRLGSTSYRVAVNTIEGHPYVAISHWWFNRAQATWFPSKKQIFLPKDAWFGLIEQSENISKTILPIEDPEASSIQEGGVTEEGETNLGLKQNDFHWYFLNFFLSRIVQFI